MMKHGIVYGGQWNKIHHWTHYYFYVKINNAWIGNFNPEHILTRWVREFSRILLGFASASIESIFILTFYFCCFADKVVPRPVSAALQEKFKTLRDRSRVIWADVIAKLEEKKRVKKEKADSTPTLSTGENQVSFDFQVLVVHYGCACH